MKLTEEEEKIFKTNLKFSDDAEMLLRVFKLFNFFYLKCKEVKDSKQPEDELKAEEVIQTISTFYQRESIYTLISLLNDILRVVSNANIELTESLSNLIFCVFGSFLPEVYFVIHSIEDENKAITDQQQ